MESNDYKLIDQFLQKELDKDEQSAFQDRLQTDQAFAEAYQIRQQMTDYLRAKAEQPNLEKKLSALGQQYFKEEKQQKNKITKLPIFRSVLAIAAAIALLFMVWNPFQSGDLYGEFAKHPSLFLVEKSTNTAIFQQAEQAYSGGEYEVAYEALTKVVEIEPSNHQAKLALGISALESGRIEEAQAIFKDLTNSDNTSINSYGQWYLALSYIKLDKNEEARPILESMTNSEPSLKRKAEQLLREF